ncbi:N-6 DNA methylase [Staphylococcus aureus]|uniref:HsdM family class I SAM-dependent methyltransferase n=1 Tax=Staphylococcus aureus TaxID=1280 RepID=UPI001C268397|nr:N-6 DNA methylase [Staphylococcus aureus]MBU9802313.1 N-6 DNA methylase [Staphylococcus aureus]
MNEKTGIDQFMRKEIESLGVSYDEQQSSNVEIAEALKTASKSLSGKIGKPEFLFFSNEFLVVVEDKKDIHKHEMKSERGELILDSSEILKEYAVNGAVHYAQHIIKYTNIIDKVFAVGASGDGHTNHISIYYVDNGQCKFITNTKSMKELHPDHITEIYKVSVLGELTKEEIEVQDVKKFAAQIHEDLRNYGSLESERKASVVSAILLALENRDEIFNLDMFTGLEEEGVRDGDKIYNAVQMYLKQNADIRPAKNGEILESFMFIKNDLKLNRIHSQLNMTPLKYFSVKLKNKFVHNDMDILGSFYGEFVKYGGNDGNALGIVLTPRHITNLMCELISINHTDFVLDPCCGSGGFLVTAMNKMFNLADTKEEIKSIKQNQIHGIELTQSLFTTATTNMILRGDGKSNLRRDDVFHVDKEYYKDKINKILLNPPYSQAKTKNLSHLSEISFIKESLEYMKTGGKLAAIIPQSTMIGKTKNDKNYKREILEKHSLETVITLNKDTFYGVGVNPCIAIFTAGIPQDEKKRVNFVNFTDDGYVVRKHIGLVGDGTEKSKKEYLLNVLNDYEDADTNFLVKSPITWEDEWLHSFFYYNEEIPTDEDFEKTIADYLSFEFDMKLHGRGYLFDDKTE